MYSSVIYTYTPAVGITIINTDKVASNLEIREYFESVLMKFNVATNIKFADSDKLGVLNKIRTLCGSIVVTNSKIEIRFDKFNIIIELVDDSWKVISSHLDEPVTKVTLLSAIDTIKDIISSKCTLLPNII